MLKAATSDKSPGAHLIAGNEGSWSLVSDGKDSRLIGRIGWQSATGTVAFGLESSATLQKNKTAVELLNLDGIAKGDAALAGQVSFRGFLNRRRGNLIAVCEQVNLAIERQIRTDRGGAYAEPLRGDACNLDALRDIGGSWAWDADQVLVDAQTWACGELSKLNPEIVLVLPNTPLQGNDVPRTRFGKTGDCTRENFISEAAKELARRERSPGVVEAKASVETARTIRVKLLEESAAIDARFAGIADPTERQAAASRRIELVGLVAAQDKALADAQGALEKLLPPFLSKPAAAFDAKESELRAGLCKRYNEPDRSAEIKLSGNKQTCVLGPIETSIATLSDARVRDRLRMSVISNLPAAIWMATLRGGVANNDFEYVDPSALPGFTTFEGLAKGVTAETEHDTHFGVAGTLQLGANSWRLGYDRKNVHQGGEAADVCVAVAAGSGVERCVQAALGAPVRVDENIATLEYRRLVTSKLGVAVRALFLEETLRKKQLIEDEWEGHFVLYFLAHASKGLNGGIDVAYDTAFDNTSAKLFIGQSFNLFE